MKVSDLLSTLEKEGIVIRAYISLMDSTDFTGPHKISDLLKDPAFTDYRISTVKLWSIQPGMYETFLWIYI